MVRPWSVVTTFRDPGPLHGSVGRYMAGVDVGPVSTEAGVVKRRSAGSGTSAHGTLAWGEPVASDSGATVGVARCVAETALSARPRWTSGRGAREGQPDDVGASGGRASHVPAVCRYLSGNPERGRDDAVWWRGRRGGAVGGDDDGLARAD